MRSSLLDPGSEMVHYQLPKYASWKMGQLHLRSAGSVCICFPQKNETWTIPLNWQKNAHFTDKAKEFQSVVLLYKMNAAQDLNCDWP